ncbi:hypothetical protein K439DRAFT_407731 [Ramaria rubella]|nr:hypothetical protein K439DRAFT_407731 [Ramaria rubella]
MSSTNAKMQEVLTELRSDSANKQQVLDMLRDRLTDTLSDLASSRLHANEVEEAYAVECRSSHKALADLRISDAHVLELTCDLKQQQRECLDATTFAGTLESKLKNSELEIGRLGREIQEQNSTVLAAAVRESKISDMEAIIKNQKAKLQLFEVTFQENIQLKATNKEQEDQLTSLNQSLGQIDVLKEARRGNFADAYCQRQQHQTGSIVRGRKVQVEAPGIGHLFASVFK